MDTINNTEPVNRTIVCLANSYKHGGRCIAGIEIEDDISGGFIIIKKESGLPQWLRPVTPNGTGEIPNSIAKGIRPMQIIRIINARPAGTQSHSENVLYDHLEVTPNVCRPTAEFLWRLLDRKHTDIFGNTHRAITPEMFRKGDHSLMLIRVKYPHIYTDDRFERPKHRVVFTFNDAEYDLPITDPNFIQRIRRDLNLNRTYETLYLVISLGMEFEELHHKLITTVITPLYTDY